MLNKDAKKTQNFVPVKEIRDGVVILENKSLVALLMVSSLNLALKSSDEQTAILSQFQDFLNSLEFSVQIFVQSKRLDIRPYITMLETRHREQINELIKIQTKEYIAFVKDFTERVSIMSKNFFVVVSYNPPILDTGQGLKKIFGTSHNKEAEMKKNNFEESRTQLEQRLSIVEQGLTRTGVRLARLGTEEVVEVLYKLLNPGEFTKPIQLNI